MEVLQAVQSYAYAGADIGGPIAMILAYSAIGASIAVMAGFGVGLGQGITAAKAVEAIGRQPEATGQIRTTMIIGQAIAETGTIYGFLIAFLLMFANPFVDIFLDAVSRI